MTPAPSRLYVFVPPLKRGAVAGNGQEPVSTKRCGGTTSLTYDYEGRVTGITYPSAATNSFTYNGLDTRVGKVD